MSKKFAVNGLIKSNDGLLRQHPEIWKLVRLRGERSELHSHENMFTPF
jgi:hypothetical protein